MFIYTPQFYGWVVLFCLWVGLSLTMLGLTTFTAGAGAVLTAVFVAGFERLIVYGEKPRSPRKTRRNWQLSPAEQETVRVAGTIGKWLGKKCTALFFMWAAGMIPTFLVADPPYSGWDLARLLVTLFPLLWGIQALLLLSFRRHSTLSPGGQEWAAILITPLIGLPLYFCIPLVF